MSWLVDFAGKAEDFLNKIDKNAAVALNTSSNPEKGSRPKKSEPFLEPNPDAPTTNSIFSNNSNTDQNYSTAGGSSTTSAPTTISRQNETKPLLSNNSNSKDSRSKYNARKGHSHSTKPSSGPSMNSSPSLGDKESFNPTSSSNIPSSRIKDEVEVVTAPQSKSSSSKNFTVTQNGVDKRKHVPTMNGTGTEGSGQKANEDELIAYLNSSDTSGLNESLILKDEVESQARELKLLTRNHRSLQKEHEELNQALKLYKEKLTLAECARSSNEAEEKDLRKLLEEKDEEIASLSSKHQQALDAIQKLELSQENVQKLEHCILENTQLKGENEGLRQRTEMLMSQVETAEGHVLSMKSTLSSMEKEFTNYKEKAKSILNYKDELIQSLKNPDTPRSEGEQGEEGIINSSSNNPEELLAEVTALKNERELLQADLSQTRAIVESLKDDNIRLEKELNTVRCFAEDLSLQLKREKETVTSLQSENLQVCQQLSSLQFELEREKNESKRSLELVTKLKSAASSSRLGESENSTNQNGFLGNHPGGGAVDREVSKLKTRVNALSQSLYEKQSLINDLSTDKQLLQIELERMKNELREIRLENNSEFCHSVGGLPQTVIASQPLYLSESPWDSRVSARMKRIYTQLDAVFCQFGLALRKRPNLRLGMSLYVIFLHLWVFFVLFSWMHHAAPPPE